MGGAIMPMKPLTKEQLDLINEYKTSNTKIDDFCLSKHIRNYQLNYLLNKQRILNSNNYNQGFISIPLTKNVKQDKSMVNNKMVSFNLNGFNITIRLGELKNFLGVIND